MSTEVTVINERTKVSLYAVAMAVPLAVAALVWTVNVSTTAADAKTMSQENKAEFSRKYDKVYDELVEIKGNIVEIKTLLKHREK